VPKWWIDLATASSQRIRINPSYGYTFWVNTDGMLWSGVPKDAFAFMGYESNRCYVVPSLELVVVSLGFTPGLVRRRAAATGRAWCHRSIAAQGPFFES
jgi:CubicO group peptidase (beta-lactamase class C family)